MTGPIQKQWDATRVELPSPDAAQILRSMMCMSANPSTSSMMSVTQHFELTHCWCSEGDGWCISPAQKVMNFCIKKGELKRHPF